MPLFAAEGIDRLVGFPFHRGILACGVRPESVPWRTLATGDRPLKLVICSQISDPENLGGVVRNAAAFGVDAIIVGPQCGDIFARRVARVSMGSVFHMPIDVVDNLACEIESMSRDYGVDVFATVLDNGKAAAKYPASQVYDAVLSFVT